MSKYIDKGVLIERMNRTRPYEGSDGSFERYRRLQWLADMEQVNMCPAADVAEVRHGRWIDGKRMKLDGTFHWFRQCSECFYEREDDTPEKDTNYCPNCGSRMDLDEVDE